MKTPQDWHRRRRHHQPFETCWVCQRAAAICRSKGRFPTRAEAEAEALDLNVRRDWTGRLVVEYWCRWCSGYHLHTARSSRDRKRVRRRHRLWINKKPYSRGTMEVCGEGPRRKDGPEMKYHEKLAAALRVRLGEGVEVFTDASGYVSLDEVGTNARAGARCGGVDKRSAPTPEVVSEVIESAARRLASDIPKYKPEFVEPAKAFVAFLRERV